jgi:heterogeneous nuclear ribonucleoprotein A1/A3
MLGGAPSMGDPTPGLGGYLPQMPSLPDLGGMLPSIPSMPDLGSLMPSMPTPNIPGVNLDIDTDAGTASGGIDFHDGTSGKASYGPGGLDVSGQSGSTRGAGHVSAGNDWSFSGATTTQGGTSLGGSIGDDHGQFSGSLSGAGPGGDTASIGGYGGSQGYGGMGTYDGQYGNLNLGF